MVVWLFQRSSMSCPIHRTILRRTLGTSMKLDAVETRGLSMHPKYWKPCEILNINFQPWNKPARRWVLEWRPAPTRFTSANMRTSL